MSSTKRSAKRANRSVQIEHEEPVVVETLHNVPLAEEPSKHVPKQELSRQSQHCVDEIYNGIRDAIADLQDGESFLDEIMDISSDLMVMVRKYPQLKGWEKKLIILRVLKRAAQDIDFDDDKVNAAFEWAVNHIIPRAIDVIIMAADGDLELGRRWRKTKKVWNKISCVQCQCAE